MKAMILKGVSSFAENPAPLVAAELPIPVAGEGEIPIAVRARGAANLCGSFRAAGRDVNGGYAEFMTVPAAFAHPIPAAFSDAEAAPLLCAGAMGWRSLRFAGLRDGQNLGLTSFGASAHLVLTMVRHIFPH